MPLPCAEANDSSCRDPSVHVVRQGPKLAFAQLSGQLSDSNCLHVPRCILFGTFWALAASVYRGLAGCYYTRSPDVCRMPRTGRPLPECLPLGVRTLPGASRSILPTSGFGWHESHDARPRFYLERIPVNSLEDPPDSNTQDLGLQPPDEGFCFTLAASSAPHGCLLLWTGVRCYLIIPPFLGGQLGGQDDRSFTGCFIRVACNVWGASGARGE